MVQSIPASAIVDVIPGVLSAGGSALDMSGLILSESTRVPIGTVKSFPSESDVASYFGSGSDEAAAASIYFLGFDNSNVKPGAMLFAQYPASAVSAYLIGGNISAMALATLQAISGSLSVTVDGNLHSNGTVNFSAATSFSSAATIIQTAMNASPATIASITGTITGTTLTITAISTGTVAPGQTVLGGTTIAGTYITKQLSGTTGGVGTYQVNQTQTATGCATTQATPVAVTYDSVAGAFKIASGVVGAISTIGFASGTTAATLLLTSATGAVTSQGADAATPGTFMDGVTAQSQDWASFTTLFDPDGGSGNVNKLAFATWNNAQDNRYLYVPWDTDASPTTQVPATTSLSYLVDQADYSGICCVWAPNYNKSVFVCGAMASIDFAETNGRVTGAFRSQTGLTADVTSEIVADNLIANGYNFYGAYATANDQFTFFYNGSVSGPFLWLDSYINEIWLNNQFQLALMTLLTNAKSIPYNAAGYAMIEAACFDVINNGLNFGAFRAGVTLSASQIANVNNAAGKNIATTLQNQGWYLQISNADAQTRAARGSPPCTFWYVDGQSVQKISLSSIELQ